jgi:hypothetical protein
MSNWRVITLRTKPLGKKVRPITDISSTALRKKLWYGSRLFGMNSFTEGTMWHRDLLLGNNHKKTRQ